MATHADAASALNDMISNGAVFHVIDGVIGRSFTYEVTGTGDQKRCRRILRDVRADTAIFAAFRAAVLDMVGAAP